MTTKEAERVCDETLKAVKNKNNHMYSYQLSPQIPALESWESADNEVFPAISCMEENLMGLKGSNSFTCIQLIRPGARFCYVFYTQVSR